MLALATQLLLASMLPWDGAALQARVAHSDLSTPLPADAPCGPGDHFTLAAVGDVLLHTPAQEFGEARGYAALFDRIKEPLRAADFTYANLEGNLNGSRPHSDYPVFNYNPAVAQSLVEVGVGVVSVANNHALDTGVGGVEHTLDVLEKARLPHHGTSRRGEARAPYLPLELKSASGAVLQAAFISATFGTNSIPDPNGLVNRLWDERGQVTSDLIAAVRKAHREREFVMVAAHWGSEYHPQPNDQQRAGAQSLADAGADVIWGDHPHTLQPVEWLLAADGRRVLVIYSLGNFVASMSYWQVDHYTQTSVIFYVGVTRTANGARVDGFRYLPVFIEDDIQPTPLNPRLHPAAFHHVLAAMRDPEGARVVEGDHRVTLCSESPALGGAARPPAWLSSTPGGP